MRYVNSKVNKFSRITEVVEEDGGFEKTPTHKIRRFKYNGSNNAKTGEASHSATTQTPPAEEKGSESADSSSEAETRSDA